MRIYLAGFMGAGKTSVGGSLSSLLRYPLLDLDREVESREGLTVREIFERHGEAFFRESEHFCLEETARYEDVIVATGGGTMTFPRNADVIRRLGTSVWLNPSFETIAARVRGRARDERPLFRSEEAARELFHSRLAAYRQCDLEIDVGPGESAAEVALRIARSLRERSCVI